MYAAIPFGIESEPQRRDMAISARNQHNPSPILHPVHDRDDDTPLLGPFIAIMAIESRVSRRPQCGPWQTRHVKPVVELPSGNHTREASDAFKLEPHPGRHPLRRLVRVVRLPLAASEP